MIGAPESYAEPASTLMAYRQCHLQHVYGGSTQQFCRIFNPSSLQVPMYQPTI